MDVLASYSIFQELQLVHDTGYFSALPSLEETWQQTCLELERYLQTEPRRISETFGEDLDCFLHASPPPCIEDSFRRLDPLLLPVEAAICDKSSAVDILLSRDKLLSETCLSLQPTSSSLDSYTAVNQAQLNAVTSLTPPSSPELSRHLVKTSQTLSAVDGTVTLKLVAKKAALGSVKVGGVATAAAAVTAAGTVKSGQSDSEQAGAEACPENKKRVHRCQFNGCRKVYTKSSHLKAHQRTHTGSGTSWPHVAPSASPFCLELGKGVCVSPQMEDDQEVRSLTSARGKGVSGVLPGVMSSQGTTGNTRVRSPSSATTATGVFPGLTILPST